MNARSRQILLGVREIRLSDAQRKVARDLDGGVTCPCCHTHLKRYKRKLNSGMAVMLVRIYRITNDLKPDDGWIHVTSHFLSKKRNAVAQEFDKLRWWGLLESTGHKEGWWRITPRGRRFVEEKLSLPRRVYIISPGNRFEGYVDANDLTDIRSALSDKFDLEELLRG